MKKSGLNILTFWQRHPALLYGIALFLGTYSALRFSFALLVPNFLLFTPLLFCSRRLALSLLIFFAGIFAVRVGYVFPESQEIQGIGHFKIASVQKVKNHFSYSWVYKGSLLSFTDESKNLIAKNIPCIAVLNEKIPSRPSADGDYFISCTLVKNTGYQIKTDKETAWMKVNGTFSFAEMRYFAKQWVINQIHAHIQDPKSRDFLSGIVTGDFDDKLLKLDFRRFGLLHIMAISGFHFAILSSIALCLLRALFPNKVANCVLVPLLGLYAFFLGWTPSIVRAFVMILIFLLSQVFEKRGSSKLFGDCTHRHLDH